MGLSPSTLFHFTSKTGLKGILKENFKLKYCIEEINIQNKPIEVSIPMVSFCDIKISEIKEHISKYGNYGIGLSKKWAIEKGLNPVIYLNTSSSFPNEIIYTIRELKENIGKNDYLKLSNFIRYIKKYEGELKRKGKLIKNYRFADEREWRYVPEMKHHPNFKHWLIPNEYNNLEKKQKENNRLKEERLSFDANHILYIVVNKEYEIDEIIEYIKKVKGKKYSMNEIERLTTRILSCERIFNDF